MLGPPQRSPKASYSGFFTINLPSRVDNNTGEVIHTFGGHQQPVQSLAFSPDSKLLASRSITTLNVHRIEDKQKTYNPSRLIDHLQYNPEIVFTKINSQENPVILSNDVLAQVYYKSSRTPGITQESIEWSSDSSDCFALSANKKFLARHQGMQKKIQIWNLEAETQFASVTLDLKPKYNHLLALNSTGNILAVHSCPSSTLENPFVVFSYMSYGSNKSDLLDIVDRLSGDMITFSEITLWNVATNSVINKFTVDSKNISVIQFSPDDKILAIGGNDKNLKLWNVQTAKEIASLRAYSPIHALAFHPLKPILAIINNLGNIIIYDLESLEEIHRFQAYQEYDNSLRLEFSPDGKFLAINDTKRDGKTLVTNKKIIRLWTLTIPKNTKRLKWREERRFTWIKMLISKIKNYNRT